jgi:transcriptional regulator with XRE-family HTH domain
MANILVLDYSGFEPPVKRFFMSKLGQRLRQLRTERALTMDQVAGQVGLIRQTISDFERGKSTPSFAVFNKLADLFGVTLDHLAGKDGVAEGPEDKQFQAALAAFTRTDWDVPRLASRLRLKPDFLAQVIEGTVNCPAKTKFHIAKALNMPYQVLLEIGQDILDGHEVDVWSSPPSLPDWLLPCAEELMWLDEISQKAIVNLIMTLNKKPR